MDLEGLLAEDLDGQPTGFGEVFRRAVAALQRSGVRFAVVGAVALGKRAGPRYTTDLDLLVEPGRWREAITAIRKAGFTVEDPDEVLTTATDRKTGVDVDLMFGVGDPEETALETATEMWVFRIKAPVARAEMLLWMYLNSDQPRHQDDGAAILRAGKVDVKWLDHALQATDDRSARIKLRRWIQRVAEEENRPPGHWLRGRGRRGR